MKNYSGSRTCTALVRVDRDDFFAISSLRQLGAPQIANHQTEMYICQHTGHTYSRAEPITDSSPTIPRCAGSGRPATPSLRSPGRAASLFGSSVT